MTSNTVSAKLYAILQPLEAVRHDLIDTCILAEANKLPRPFLQTLSASTAALGNTWETLNDIATTLDPARATDQL